MQHRLKLLTRNRDGVRLRASRPCARRSSGATGLLDERERIVFRRLERDVGQRLASPSSSRWPTSRARSTPGPCSMR
jgi:hypothetical protein